MLGLFFKFGQAGTHWVPTNLRLPSQTKPSGSHFYFAGSFSMAEIGAFFMAVRIPETDTLLPAEAALLLRVPESWLKESVRSRSRSGIPFLKIGKYVRFSKQKLIAWQEQQSHVAQKVQRKANR